MRAWLLFAVFLMALLLTPTTVWALSPEDTIAIPAAANAQPFDAQAATQAYLDSVPKSQRVKTDAYFEGGYWIALWGTVLTIAIAALLMFSGLSVRLRDLAQRVTRLPFIHASLYAAMASLVMWLLSLPFTIYTGYFREHQYGLSNLSFGGWFSEALIDLGVSLLLGSLAIAVIYGVIRKSPRHWWLWGAVASMGMLSVLILISPVFISPLFNHYKPVSKLEVKESVLSLARANGVPAKEVYEFDASKQTKRVSANVSGFAGTMRISLNDNLLNRTSLAETRMVMAHEIGHYVLNHMYKLLLMFGLVIVLIFALMSKLFEVYVKRYGERTGVKSTADVAGFPVLLALFTALSLLFTPINNTIIRVHEVEADLFGLNASREPDAFATTALKLGEYRKLDPSPLEEMIFFDHPSGRSRISMAMNWKAEQLRQAK